MTTKTFDAVKLMRELRDELSRAMETMTSEERSRYIRDRAAKTSLGRSAAADESTVAGEEDETDRPPRGR
jgi:hypothetical protein